MDFRKIVKSSGKTHREAAEKMFPNNTYPYTAYTRMASQGIPLNETQLMALSEVTGYSIQQIMEMRAIGKQKVVPTKKNNY